MSECEWHTGPLERGRARTLGVALQRVLGRTGLADLDFEVGPAGARQPPGRERLRLAVRAEGVFTPAEALRAGARMLTGCLDDLAAVVPVLPTPAASDAGVADPWLSVPVQDLGLPVRATLALCAAGLLSIGDLLARDEAELAQTPHLGRRALFELKSALAARGLVLAQARRPTRD